MCRKTGSCPGKMEGQGRMGGTGRGQEIEVGGIGQGQMKGEGGRGQMKGGEGGQDQMREEIGQGQMKGKGGRGQMIEIISVVRRSKVEVV